MALLANAVPLDLTGPESPFKNPHGLSPQATLAWQLGIYAGIAAVVLGLRWALGHTEPLAPLPLGGGWAEVGWGFAALVVLILMNVFLSVLGPKLPLLRDALPWYIARNELMFGRLPIAVLACMALLAGIGEEILFRAWLQPIAGLTLTALAFTLAHVPPSDYKWTHKATWGMALFYLPVAFFIGWLFEWRGSLIAPMTAHLLLDLMGLLTVQAQAVKSAANGGNGNNDLHLVP